MYFHTSFSVLISFIFFSPLSPFCLFFSLHLSLCNFFSFLGTISVDLVPPPFSQRLYHFLLRLFTFLSNHSFFLPALFVSLTVTSFFVVAFSITSFISASIFSTSCSSNVACSSLLLYSSTPCSFHTYCHLLLLLPCFSFSPFFVVRFFYTYFQREML
jgi:hypothetical protein